ncbi:MAG TPA: peroxiredoxin [Candidatus Kryptonia bacterium]|nr:peroxiredoxin [Candidatus Kryptonia bacterium]
MMRQLLVFTLFFLSASVVQAADLLKIGDRFPTWSLVDHAGKTVSSSDLIGQRYLLWFYPKAMTAGCTAEGDGLRDKFAQFKKAGVEVLGVSFDQPEQNARFVREQQFPFRLLSDSQKKLAMFVGAADSVLQPTARRISYLVGADGRVLHAYNAVIPSAHADEVLRDLTPAR